jgi:hypothetical protein
MDDDDSNLPPPKRTPWNKGKLIGAKPPLLARASGPFGRSFKSKGELASWQCSISPLIASCEAAMSSR